MGKAAEPNEELDLLDNIVTAILWPTMFDGGQDTWTDIPQKYTLPLVTTFSRG